MLDHVKSNMDRVNESKPGDTMLGLGVIMVLMGIPIGLAFEITSGTLFWPCFIALMLMLVRFNDYRARWKAVGGRGFYSGGIMPSASTSGAGAPFAGRKTEFGRPDGAPACKPCEGGVD